MKKNKIALLLVFSASLFSCNNNVLTQIPISSSTNTTTVNTSTITPTTNTTNSPSTSSNTSIDSTTNSPTTNTPTTNTPTTNTTIAPTTNTTNTPSTNTTAAPSTSTSTSTPSTNTSTSTSSSTIVNTVISNVSATNEAISFDLALPKSDSLEVLYRLSSSNSFTSLDKELILAKTSSTSRVEIVGLSSGSYQIEVKNNSNLIDSLDNVNVYAYDRSGYAHFNSTESIGAYNSDGSLKSNAQVVYVSNATKNTVQFGSYKGLGNILANASKINTPLCIRFLDTIETTHWNEINYGPGFEVTDKDGNVITTGLSESEIISKGINSMSDDEAKGITKLNGLVNKLSYKDGEYDSYFGMMDVSNFTKGLTIEGIGENAGTYQWGFTFKSCSNIEIRNLTFSDNPEDSCSFEGSSSNPTQFGRYFVHHNVFNQGKNRWDLTAEQDKHEGDGATDVKYVSYVTFAYNNYNNCHKTGLVGGSDSQQQYNITFHHNYYNNNGSRLPLARQANMHMYNNYYYKSTGTNMSIRANAYAFLENNYFDQVNNPVETKPSSTTTPAAKSYGNTFNNCTGSNHATIVNSRTQEVTSTNLYSNFDTNSSSFYYDSTNKISKVSYLTSAEQAKTDALIYAGVHKASVFDTFTTPDVPVIPDVPDVPTEATTLDFNSLESKEYTSSISTGIFSINADGSHPVTIGTASNFSNIDSSIQKELRLGGSGKANYRSISFTITEPMTIKVIGRSSSTTSARQIKIVDTSSSNVVYTSEATITALEMTTTLEAGTYYISSVNSGFNIGKVTLSK